MLRLAAPVLAFLVLSGCASGGSSSPNPPPVSLTPVCPAVKTYTPDEQKALAKAVAVLPADSPIIGALGDYSRMRAASRACGKQGHSK
jgi:hypothetical protein